MHGEKFTVMPIFTVSRPEEVKEASSKNWKNYRKRNIHSSPQKNTVNNPLCLLLNSYPVIFKVLNFSVETENFSSEIQQLLSQSESTLHVHTCMREVTSIMTKAV
jgi:hypothetical protein